MTDKPAILFIHGLWLHAASWQNWVAFFEREGYHAIAPGWGGDADTPEMTRTNANALRGQGIEEVSEGFRKIIRTLDSPPILVGHSFGGLLAQKLLGEGLARGAVALSPGQIKGVKRVPLAQLRSGLPVLTTPRNYGRAVSISSKHFRYAFANAVSQSESDALYRQYVIPGPGKPVFQLGVANFFSESPAKVRLDAENRGPLLIVGAGMDRSAPAAIANEAFHLHGNNPGITDYSLFPDRGHSYVFDSGWKKIAEHVAGWLKKHDL